MSEDTQRSDRLLRRARELEARAGERKPPTEESGASQAVEGLAWIGRTIRRTRQIFAEIGQVLEHLARYAGPFRPLGRGLWRATTYVARRASHVRNAEGVYEFSPRQVARSVVAAVALPFVVYLIYNVTTRHRGAFLINDKHLVSADTDEYQIGGCWQHTSEQASCNEGEGVIVLIRPTWIPGTGIFSITYDEDVGLVPLQGKCDLETYGIYLRLPWMPLLRGVLKPVAISIGLCKGITSTTAGSSPGGLPP